MDIYYEQEPLLKVKCFFSQVSIKPIFILHENLNEYLLVKVKTFLTAFQLFLL